MNLHEILLSDDVVDTINNNMAYMLEIIPEIKGMIGFDHKHPHHHLDVWKHTLYALSLSEKDFDTRLCLLLHDIGKPLSYTEGKDGIRHFFNHPKVSAEMSKIILERLDFDDEYIKYMCYLISHHDSPIKDEQIDNNYELCLKLYEIQKCDALAHHPDKLEKRKKYLKITKEKILKKRIKMDNYFEKYIEAKKCLYDMVLQFFTTYITFAEAKELDLEILKNDIYLDKYVEICSHNFKSDGLLAWNYLSIDKDYLTFNEMYELKLDLKNEQYDTNINYYKEYLKISILLIDIKTKYYYKKIPKEDAVNSNIQFNEDIDEIGNNVDVCYHMCESAGENVWNLLKIDDNVIGCSILNNKKDNYVKELLKIKKEEKVLSKKKD